MLETLLGYTVFFKAFGTLKGELITGLFHRMKTAFFQEVKTGYITMSPAYILSTNIRFDIY